MTRTTLMAACWQLWLNLGQEMYSSAQVINLPMRKATGITTAQVMCVVFYLIWRTLFLVEKVCCHILLTLLQTTATEPMEQ